MKALVTFFFVLACASLCAQENLKFDKKFVQSEDKWVVFPADSIGQYNFGFIYIDSQAGLTLDYAGSFKIDKDGKYIASKTPETSLMKYRLQPNNTLVAFIPEAKFSELQVNKIPDWLKIYKRDEQSIEWLYRRGYMYNGWNECAKALEYLDKAAKINSEFKGLRVELAFSYNCLGQYQKAIEVLQKAIKSNPSDAYINKELIFAQAKGGHLDNAAKNCRKVVKELSDKTYNAENAYNVLQGYFLKKDVENFNKWLIETSSYLSNNEQFKGLVEKMQAEIRINGR